MRESGPRPRPIRPCGGMELPEAELMQPNEKLGMTLEPRWRESSTKVAENDESPPYV